MSVTTRAVRIAKALFTPAALAAIFYVAWESREHLINSIRLAELPFLLLSVTTWILLHAIAPAFSVAGLGTFGYRASFKDAFFIHNRRLPAKYLPGGIWHTVAKGVDYKNQGASSFQITCYLVAENLMLVAGASMLGSIILLYTQTAPSLDLAFIAVISGGLIFLLLGPVIFQTYNNSTTKIFHTKPYVFSIFLIFIHWGIAATSFTLYLQAFPDIKAALSFVQIAGAYLVSWAAGYITIFAPQGIGVSEVISASLLKGAGNLGSLIALIATFRAVIFIGDIGAWMLTAIIFHFKK